MTEQPQRASQLQREITTYEDMRRKEQEKRDITRGRRKWLNRQINEKREQLRKLIGGSE